MSEKRYGVLCYLAGSGKDRIVLVTRRSRKEWILPKGRRISGKSGPESALQEAYEEGGIKGRVFPRKKTRVICEEDGKKIHLTLYSMRVDRLLKHWPERDDRRRAVVSPEDAERMLSCPGMRRGLRQLTRNIR